MNSQTGRNIAVAAALCVLLQGCAAFSCDNYQTYDDVLDSWVGADLSSYERRQDLKPLQVMDRPGGKFEYTFDTPYYDYAGNYNACRTLLEVDGDSAEIVSWSYTGNCYLHGRCVD
jgi:hypothetical protein